MVNLALIGVGRWGQNYLRTVSKINDCKIIYLCSPTIEKKYFPPEYTKITNYKDLLSVTGLDGIIISTPASTHYKIASEFIKKDFNVLLEKPLVTSVNQANKLYKLMINSKSKIFPGNLYLYNQGIIKIKKLMPSIGSVKKIECVSFSNGPIRDDIDDLWDRAYHDIYICNYLLNYKPISVSCAMSNDVTKLILNYSNKTKSSIKVTSHANKKIRLFKILGSEGQIIYNDIKRNILLLDKLGNIKKEQNINTNPLKNEVLAFIKIIGRNENYTSKEIFDTVKILSLAKKSRKQFGRPVLFT